MLTVMQSWDEELWIFAKSWLQFVPQNHLKTLQHDQSCLWEHGIFFATAGCNKQPRVEERQPGAFAPGCRCYKNLGKFSHISCDFKSFLPRNSHPAVDRQPGIHVLAVICNHDEIKKKYCVWEWRYCSKLSPPLRNEFCLAFYGTKIPFQKQGQTQMKG